MRFAGMRVCCPRSRSERQRDELLLMLRTDHAAVALRLLDDLDLLDRLLPEAAVMRDVEQPKEHTWNVFGHSLAAVEALDMDAGGGRTGTRSGAVALARAMVAA